MCWQQNCPQEAELAAFPQPLILTLVQEFTAHELPFVPIPWGGHDVSQTIVMIWVKNNPSKPSPPPKPADCVFAPQDTQLFDTVLCTDRGRELCQVPLSQALK